MTKDLESQPRALPAAVFVPEHTLKMIVGQIAKLPEDKREKALVVLIRTGRYRASTDQVVLYHHGSKLPPPKADLVGVTVCRVVEIDEDRRSTMGASSDDEQFLVFLRKYWDESLELDSPVTVIICSDLRGDLVESYIEMNKFHNTLPQFSQE